MNRRTKWAPIFLALLLAGCGATTSSAPPTATSPATAPPATSPSATSLPARPTPTPVTFGQAYLSFTRSLCSSLSTSNVSAVQKDLPYYQYNSGVRYGQLGDGEGQTGDPSILSSWLNGHTIRCRYITPDNAGHGAILTSGWPQPGGWSIIELDVFNSQWKINDFTFGGRHPLYHAIHVAGPVEPYQA